MIVEPKKAGERIQQLGNKTECGLLGWVKRIGGDYEQIRKRHPEEGIHKVYTFNSSRKMMMTVIRLNANAQGQCTDGQQQERQIGFRVFCKGASEIILNRCKFLLDQDGKVEEFKEEKKQKLLKCVIERMAEDGLRTIAIGYKDYLFKGAKETPTEPTQVKLKDRRELRSK
jgi:magnesium-transporting ATPase (P-type)